MPGTDWARTGGILLVCSDTGSGLMVVPVPASPFCTCEPSSNVAYVESTRRPKETLISTLHLWGYPGLSQAQVPEEWSGKQMSPAGYHGIGFMGLCEIGPLE